jgi:putative Ca2+/H+ antiporter (TMEM165/GDT1 family)
VQNHHGARDSSLDGFSKTLDKHREPGWGTRFVYGLNNYPCPNEHVVSVLAISITTVALAEIGDKTQLLSLLLASRYRKPIPIIAAIFFATIANHALAAWLGVVVADYLSPEVLKWVLVVSFAAMAAWVLIPDKLDDDEEISNRGPFVASFIAFFVAEIGDKTQIATSILGAQYADALSLVVLGTTIGMLLANVPVVLIGKLSADKMPLALIRKITAALFAALAIGAYFYS